MRLIIISFFKEHNFSNVESSLTELVPVYDWYLIHKPWTEGTLKSTLAGFILNE